MENEHISRVEMLLLKFIKRCIRSTRPDLQSFVIEIDSGKCFVQCDRSGDVWLDGFSWDKDGNETRWQFRSSADIMAHVLFARGARLETLCQ